MALRKGIPLLRKKGVQAIPTVDNNLAISVCRNVSMLLNEENDRKYLKELEGNYKKLADKIIILAFSWGVAGGLANQEIYEKISTELFNPGDLPKGKTSPPNKILLIISLYKVQFSPTTFLSPSQKANTFPIPPLSLPSPTYHLSHTFPFSFRLQKPLAILPFSHLTFPSSSQSSSLVLPALVRP